MSTTLERLVGHGYHPGGRLTVRRASSELPGEEYVSIRLMTPTVHFTNALLGAAFTPCVVRVEHVEHAPRGCAHPIEDRVETIEIGTDKPATFAICRRCDRVVGGWE